MGHVTFTAPIWGLFVVARLILVMAVHKAWRLYASAVPEIRKKTQNVKWEWFGLIWSLMIIQ